jgi:D-beta-D-heptose 7-phosphate kinase/D-beta-D-heptose 1-phosphate adenosyltransferase
MAARVDKLVSLPALLRKRSGWRRAGRTIVFTNGIFDLLHRGHVEYLAEAKRRGDILIVGMNTDASTRKLKGPGRPINPLADRMAVLAGLESVDYVVPFREATPLKLITAIRPDILVKGSEYKKADIVGAAEVESWGGKVVRMKMRRGKSTTALIKKITLPAKV